MEKRGMSHIEMILSFVIFISAVVFIIYYFNPLTGESFSHVSALPLSNQISKNLTSNFTFYSIKIDNTNGQITTAQGNKLGVSLGFIIGNNANIRAFNSSKTEISSSIVSRNNNGDNYICLSDVKIPNFISVVLSDDISSGNSADCTGVSDNPAYYAVVSSYTKNIISEKRLTKLKENYDANYPVLKSFFGIPAIEDFEFSIKFADNTLIEARGSSIPEDTEVSSLTKRIEVLRLNGKVEFADLNVKIW